MLGKKIAYSWNEENILFLIFSCAFNFYEFYQITTCVVGSLFIFLYSTLDDFLVQTEKIIAEESSWHYLKLSLNFLFYPWSVLVAKGNYSNF